jgi:hypothetical protein
MGSILWGPMGSKRSDVERRQTTQRRGRGDATDQSGSGSSSSSSACQVFCGIRFSSK